MALPKLHTDDNGLALSWDVLGFGAPTIIGLAKLTSEAIANNTQSGNGYSKEARAILFAARQRGVIAVNASNKAFDSVDRFFRFMSNWIKTRYWHSKAIKIPA